MSEPTPRRPTRRRSRGPTASRGRGRHRRLPAEPAARRLARGVGRRPAGPVRRPALLGTAVARVRRPGGPPADRRPRAGRPRRQPDRAHLHRRSVGRLPVRGAAPDGLREPADVGRGRRRPPAARRLHRGREPLRAARQPPDARGARPLPAIPRPRARAADGGPRGPGARVVRVGRRSCCAAAASGVAVPRPRPGSATAPRSRSGPGGSSAPSTSASRTPSPAS